MNKTLSLLAVPALIALVLVAVVRGGPGAGPPQVSSAASGLRVAGYVDQPTPAGPATVYAFWDPAAVAAAAPNSLRWAVYVHGGGWHAGFGPNFSYTSSYCRDLVAHGFVCFAADYTSSADAIWPQQVHDTNADVSWILTHSAAWRLSHGKGIVIGQSAGALMAGITAYTYRLAGYADISGVIDLPHTMTTDANPQLEQTASDLVGGADPTSALARSASVLAHPPSASVATLIQQCAGDVTVDATSSAMLTSVLAERRYVAETHLYPCVEHNVDAPADHSPLAWNDFHAWALRVTS